ncbi:MAG: AMP-binding protein [Spirochaetes bacterium]|nr:AMP-binding protein [Spirochaetota bacterium]
MYQLRSFTLRDVLIQSSLRYNKLPAVAFFEKQPVTYAALGRAAAAFAAVLRARGIRPGDRVAIISENRPEWAAAYFGITAGGFVGMPILTDFSRDQIVNIVAHAGCKAVVLSEKMRTKLEHAALPEIIPIETLFFNINPQSSCADDHEKRLMKELPPLKEDSLAVILYTSGTTGHSKGVMLTHRNLVWDAWATRSIIHLRRNDYFLSVLPLAHTYECTIGMLAPIMQGSFISYMEKPPSASVLLPALATLKPSVMVTVPLIMEKIYRGSIKPALEAIKLYKHVWLRPLLHRLAGMKLKKTFGGRIRFFGIGGAGLDPEVEQFLIDARFPYAIGYGLTETAPLIAGCAPFHTTLSSTGPALHGVSLRIADPDPVTGDGEIQARGENVMLGYYREPEKTKEVFTTDGWFRTGDLGHFDSRKRLFIRGRLKAMIVGSSGENIYPEEIESLLNAHEHVVESLVYKDGGGLTALVHLKSEIIERLGAAVQDRIEDAEDILDAIRHAANARLAGFSRLVKVKLQHEPFEKTPSQKIKRFLYPVKRTVKTH